MHRFGEVVLASVQFADTFEIKKRPALILFEEQGNIVLMGITSNLEMKGVPLTKKEGAIKNSIIEPDSTVGRTSFIGDSIIGTGTDIRSMFTFQNELLGKRIKRGPIEIRGTIYTKLGAVIGNNTDIGPNTVIHPAETVGSNKTIKAGTINDRKNQDAK